MYIYISVAFIYLQNAFYYIILKFLMYATLTKGDAEKELENINQFNLITCLHLNSPYG
jgi:hypothetical protein